MYHSILEAASELRLQRLFGNEIDTFPHKRRRHVLFCARHQSAHYLNFPVIIAGGRNLKDSIFHPSLPLPSSFFARAPVLSQFLYTAVISPSSPSLFLGNKVLCSGHLLAFRPVRHTTKSLFQFKLSSCCVHAARAIKGAQLARSLVPGQQLLYS